MTQELSTFFQSLADCWRLLETIRLNIIHSEGFKPSSLFKQIDSADRGAIELEDLHHYLIKVGFSPSQGEMFTVFKELDIHKKGYISANDFEEYFGGSAEKYVGARYKFGEIDLVRKYFSQLIDNYRRLEVLRAVLSKVNPENLFSVMGPEKGEQISFDRLRVWLKEQNISAPTIEDLISFLKSKKQVSLSLQFFLNLVEPFGEISYFEPKQSPQILRKIYDETPSSSLDEYFKAKMVENQARRQFIETHEKSRKELMSGLLQRRNSPKLRYNEINASLINKSPSVPALSRQYTVNELDKILSPTTLNTKTLLIPPKHSAPNKFRLNDENIKLHDRVTLLKNIEKDFVNNTSNQFSFNNKTMSTADLSLLLRKQQEQLQFERSRRIQLEQQMMEYKKHIHPILSHQQSLLYRPIDQIHPTIDYLNYSRKEAPVFQQESFRARSACRQKREVGKIEHRGFWGKEFMRGRAEGSLEDELRRSRLDREFAKYKLQKDGGASKYLWR